ncbi:MAG: hypothetical protein R3A80_13860 [Bdellovibrionota bacterium]
MRILLLSFFVSFFSFAGASPQTADQLAAKRLAFWTDVISGKIKPREYLCHESLIPNYGIRLDASSLDDAVKVYGKIQ